MIAVVTNRLRDGARVAARATPVPLGVRCGVFLAGLSAVVLAYPGAVLFSRVGFLLLLVAPLIPALSPRGRSTTFVVVLAVAGWLVSTAPGGAPIRLSRLLALTAALYLLHALAALAAVLPYDAVVAPAVVARWVARASAVVLSAAVLAVSALAAVSRTGDRAVLVASLSGLVLGVAAVFLLVWLGRRR